MPDAPRYQTHGALVPGDPLYVRRQADHDLKEGVLAADFCYVLAPRQVGKSSLRARVLVDLRRDGIMVATANIQAGGGVKSESVWYEGIIDQLVTSARDLNSGFTFPFDWGKWWDAERGPFAQRFVKLLKEGFLAPTDCQWVITIDEIDASISLPFTDSFFAAIRLCFDQRPEQPAFRRLSIVLLGAATPTELIKDRSRTPFNIGRRIEMTDFTLAEAGPLAAPLPIADPLKPAVLTRVLHWTGGQPHLTQVVCDKLRETWTTDLLPAHEDASIADVDRCIESTFFHGGILGDAHFAYITKRARDFPRARQLLRAYRKARTPKGLLHEQRSTVAAELKIAGLVKPSDNGTLRVANPIYGRVFNEKWIRDTTPMNWPVLIGELGMAAAVLFLIVGYFIFIPRPYIEQLQTAEKDLPSEAHRRLAAIPGYKKKADELLAQFWDRRAALSEEEVSEEEFGKTHRYPREAPDFTLIYRLRALEAFPSEARRREARRVVGEKVAPLRATFRERSQIFAVAFSPDGNTVLTGSSDGTVLLWDAKSGQPKVAHIQHGGVSAVAFSPDGNVVLTGNGDGTAVLRNAQSGHQTMVFGELLPTAATVFDVAFSPDGNTVLTGSSDGTARLWDAHSGQPNGPALQHQGTVYGAAFSSDGSSVVTGSADHTARLWDARSRQPKGESLQHHDGVNAVAFSPDGSTVVTGGDDNTARFWDAQSGQSKGAPLLHQDLVRAVAFSPDGSTVLTGSGDKTARLWDTHSGQPKGMPLRHQNPVVDVDYSRDGKMVLTGSSDDTARLWDVATIEGRGESVEEALAGTPAEVLERWLKRTALQFGPDGVTLIPRYPLPAPSKENPEPRVP